MKASLLVCSPAPAMVVTGVVPSKVSNLSIEARSPNAATHLSMFRVT